jgi:hypothetical protein
VVLHFIYTRCPDSAHCMRSGLPRSSRWSTRRQ